MGRKLRFHVKDETQQGREATWVEGVHHAKVESVAESYHDDGRFLIKTRQRVVGPEPYRGQSIFEDYYIGTHEDPNADKDETWAKSVGWKLFKELAHSFNFEPSDDLEELSAQMTGSEYLPYIVPETYTGRDGKQKTKGRIKGFYKLGSRPIGTTNGKAEETAAPAKPKLQAVPSAPQFTVSLADEAE